ncbi:MAG: hypothetical protein LM565_00485 [Thermofilum sp.]|nr:hypothetical protein [Thermofilum sp.]
MVLACTIFEVLREVSAEEVVSRLSGYSSARGEVEFMGHRVALGARVREVAETPRGVSGVFEETMLTSVSLEGSVWRVPIQYQCGFRFVWRKGACYLLVLAGRRRARRVAEAMSYALFGEGGFVSHVYLPPEKLRRLYLAEDAIVRQLVVSDLEEGSTVVLYGKDLKTSRLRERLAGGREKYVVYEDPRGVFGVSSWGLVVALSDIVEEELEEYVVERILPLVEPPP